MTAQLLKQHNTEAVRASVVLCISLHTPTLNQIQVMASHAAAGDPRVRSNNDPRLLTSKDDDIRKRQASRSPAGGDKPVIKKPNQTGQALPLTNGTPSRQTSISINDPRRSNVNSPAGSRRNSITVNTNGVSGTSTGLKHLNGHNGYASPSGAMGGSGGSTPQSSAALSTAPVARMSSVAPADGPQPSNASTDLHASIFKALMDVSNQASELAISRIAFTEADNAFRKVQREYNVAEKQFVAFPAIKEQKTKAKMSMQSRYDEAHKSLQQAKAEQQKIVSSSATAITGLQQHYGTDAFVHSEPRALKAGVGRAVNGLDRIITVEQKLTLLSRRVDDSCALAEKQESKALQRTTEHLAELEKRVSEARVLAERPQAPALQQPPSSTDGAEVAELKERIEALERSEADQLDLLDKHVDDKVAERVAAVYQWVQPEIQTLQASITAVNATQHANAQTME